MNDYRTKSGATPTDQDIGNIADELEVGLDVLPPSRRRGRPRVALRDHGHSPLLSVRVSDEMLATIRAEAKENGVAVSEIVRRALEEHTSGR